MTVEAALADDRMTDAPLKEGRFRRWSRLKQQGDTDAVAPTSPAAETAVETAYAAPDPHALPGGAAIRRGSLVPSMPALAGEDEDEIGAAAVDEPGPDDDDIRELTEEAAAVVAELPPIESLTKDSDFTPFLADKVPEFIRRRALSVLWRSDPVLANLDGLNDYDENFRIIDTLIDAAKDTIYRVGKGHNKDDEPDEDEAVAAGESEAETAAAGDAGGAEPAAPGDAAPDDQRDVADAAPEPETEPELEPEPLSGSSVRKPEERG